jgi:hypothetical protein
MSLKGSIELMSKHTQGGDDVGWERLGTLVPNVESYMRGWQGVEMEKDDYLWTSSHTTGGQNEVNMHCHSIS